MYIASCKNKKARYPGLFCFIETDNSDELFHQNHFIREHTSIRGNQTCDVDSRGQ
jgi:hypothetical protein